MRRRATLLPTPSASTYAHTRKRARTDAQYNIIFRFCCFVVNILIFSLLLLLLLLLLLVKVKITELGQVIVLYLPKVCSVYLRMPM